MSPGDSKRGRPGRPRTAAPLSPAERMRRMRARRKAAGLKPTVTWVPAEPDQLAPYSPHRLLEARSLAMHAVIAEKIRRDPRRLEVARRNLERWGAKCGSESPCWLREWQAILKQPWPEIAALITEPSERGGAAEAIDTLCRCAHAGRAQAHL